MRHKRTKEPDLGSSCQDLSVRIRLVTVTYLLNSDPRKPVWNGIACPSSCVVRVDVFRQETKTPMSPYERMVICYQQFPPVATTKSVLFPSTTFKTPSQFAR